MPKIAIRVKWQPLFAKSESIGTVADMVYSELTDPPPNAKEVMPTATSRLSGFVAKGFYSHPLPA